MNRFEVVVINKTENPQTLIYQAMHQDYCDKPVWCEAVPSEEKAGKIAVDRLLSGNKGHFGCLEHPHITLNCCHFPHSVVQQARTHRVGVSFDVQSFRYTGEHICKIANGELDPEDVFYLRPVGNYTARNGKRYMYTEEMRKQDRKTCKEAAIQYRDRFQYRGFSEEHLRGVIPFDYRQHFVVTFNVRSLMHFLDLRYKKDAQLEIQKLCELIYPRFEEWAPELAQWYWVNRAQKAKLAP